jgi:hypothetical protein
MQPSIAICFDNGSGWSSSFGGNANPNVVKKLKIGNIQRKEEQIQQ